MWLSLLARISSQIFRDESYDLQFLKIGPNHGKYIRKRNPTSWTWRQSKEWNAKCKYEAKPFKVSLNFGIWYQRYHSLWSVWCNHRAIASFCCVFLGSIHWLQDWKPTPLRSPQQQHVSRRKHFHSSSENTAAIGNKWEEGVHQVNAGF